MMQKREYKIPLGVSISMLYLEKILDFQERYKLRTKSEAVEKLIDLAFKFESKLGMVETFQNEDFEQIREQLEKGNLVDYIEQLDQRTFSLIINIMRDEEKARSKRK